MVCLSRLMICVICCSYQRWLIVGDSMTSTLLKIKLWQNLLWLKEEGNWGSLLQLSYISLFFLTCSRVQLFGRFPSKEEENSYNLPGSCPAFLPADNLQPEWFTENLVDNIRLNRYKYCILGPKPPFLTCTYFQHLVVILLWFVFVILLSRKNMQFYSHLKLVNIIPSEQKYGSLWRGG